MDPKQKFQWSKNRFLRPENDLKNAIYDVLTCLATFLVTCHDWDLHQKLLQVQIDHQTDFWPDRSSEFKKKPREANRPQCGKYIPYSNFLNYGN